ncbi:MAG TPA: ubiquinol-cytochrome C chaperone family protein [Pseudolabrys sp.]|nr:ubiquinol-cytochrome C chaperone family protein [Pseudolabrys sp.]
MIFALFRRREQRQNTISALYGTIVAQARRSCFYRDFAVADTINGRFEMLVLHLALVLDRLAEMPDLRELGQGIFDTFCGDMDHNLREIGIGDLAVPKKMQRIGEAYYGRAEAYRKAVSAEDPEFLVDALVRNIYDGDTSKRALAARLAAYIKDTVGDLKAQTGPDLMAGKLHLPEPAVEDPAESRVFPP